MVREIAVPTILKQLKENQLMFYLYIKTHSKTGLKYLGYTQKKDPFSYTGSGTYWKRHLKKHGEFL